MATENYLVNPPTNPNPWTLIRYPTRKTKLFRLGKSGQWGKKIKSRKNPRVKRSRLSSIMKKAAALKRSGLSPKEAMSKAWRTNDGGVLTMHINKKRGKRKSRKHRKNPVAAFHANKRRSRRSGRRSHRRNPVAALTSGFRGSGDFAMDAAKLAAWAAGGAIVTSMGADIVGRYIPQANTPMGRMATKGGIAIATGLLVNKYVGRREGLAVALGGLAPIVQDATAMFIPQVVSGAKLALGGEITDGSSILGVYAPVNGGMGVYAPENHPMGLGFGG